MRSTAEWEAALEGTTPGPWENREYGIGPLYADIYGSVASENQKDEELAALAPEAVAEVVRLRRELTKVGEVLARMDREYATVADSNPRTGRDEYAAGYLAGIDTAYTWLQKALDGTHE